ncbi:creatininase family protein [Chloroflexota bacterium]
MKIKLDDMTWPEVEEVLKNPNAMLIPIGAVEQHGTHLPLSVDSRCADYIAEHAAKKVNKEQNIRAIVAPTIPYTDVSTFEEFPGNIGITIDTAIRLIGDIARSLARQGFKNIIFINGHSPNSALINTALRQASRDFPDAGLFAVNWWNLGYDVIPRIRKSKVCSHADELETSLSLVIQPQNVYLSKVTTKDIPKLALSAKWDSPDIFGSRRLIHQSRTKFPKYGTNIGVMGDPTVASKETGEKLLKAVIDDLAEIIVEVVRSENS